MSGGSLSIKVKDGVERADTIIKLMKTQDNKLIGVIRAVINIKTSNNNETSNNEPVED